jgi:hypothetical protein
MSGYLSPWISLTDALVRVANVVGTAESWPQIKQAIRDGALPARGSLDGVDGDFVGEWLSVLAWDEPEVDILWFDNDKRQRVNPPAPEHAERIEVESEYIERLWPIDANKTSNITDPSENNPTDLNPVSKKEIDSSFSDWANEETQRLGRPISRSEAEKWAKERDLGRERGRELQKSLPRNLRRKRGKPVKN